MINTSVLPEMAIGDGTPVTAALVTGVIDASWSDDQNVTLDRIVGAFHFHGYTVGDGSDAPPIPFLLKMGIVLNEELTEESPATVIYRRLFEQADNEQAEWLWLHSKMLPGEHGTSVYTDASSNRVDFAYTVPINCRIKRKIGPKDELAFYAAWLAAGPGFDISVQSYTDVRCVLMAK